MSDSPIYRVYSEEELAREILAGADVASLPADYPLDKMAQDRMDEIERLRAALKEVIADVDGHNLLKQHQSKHDDVLTWVSVAHARKALKGKTNEGSTK